MGLIDRARASLAGRMELMAGRLRKQPQRETDIYPRLLTLGQTRYGSTRPTWKPTPKNLRYFGRQPYARRAINAVKNPIAQLGWEVVPIDGVDSNSLLEQQCEIARRCLQTPNADDSFRSLIEQVIEDILHGAGAVEMALGGDAQRPLWLWPVDGLSIQIYAAWSGDAAEPRYSQGLGYSPMGGVNGVQLLNQDLMYLRPNPSTATPFGLGPLEVAFMTISRQLGVAQYAGDVASNAQPTFALYAGESISPEEIQTMRAWWVNEVEGRGKMPIFGGPKSPQVLSLRSGGDDALYLKYQEHLGREIAAAFDLSPQNLGIVSDVNRNTAESSEDRDWDQAIKPMAHLIESHINREAIQGRLGYSQVHFRFVGLDREDEKATANIYQLYYQGNAITPNEMRVKLGKPPMTNQWGDLCYADMQVALNAARGTALIEDRDLDQAGGKPLAKSEAPSSSKKVKAAADATIARIEALEAEIRSALAKHPPHAVNVTLNQEPVQVTVAAQAAPSPDVTVNAPVTVHAPAPAEVQAAAAPNVQVDVHVPQGAAPIVQNTINVPKLDQPHVTLEATLPPLQITATLPPRKTSSTTQIQRDAAGNIAKSTTDSSETDA